MTKIEKYTHITALVTIVGLSSWIGYLLAENERIAFEKHEKLQADSMIIQQLLFVDNAQDSIISSMPEYVPQDWNVDSNGIFNIITK